LPHPAPNAGDGRRWKWDVEWRQLGIDQQVVMLVLAFSVPAGAKPMLLETEVDGGSQQRARSVCDVYEVRRAHRTATACSMKNRPHES
jgi:hypothetical protein